MTRKTYNAYLPQDRLMALSEGREVPGLAEGSVLFADISGFTPLTEAYEAHLGARYGGEELTRILNTVYEMLIGEVDRMRGSVIGFAGDAITCWFDGDGGERAVTAALSMQKGMEAFEAVPSPGGGTIALGLKAAVTHGWVKRFVVGDEAIQRVDVLAGDPVYQVAELEGLAERGEVLIDESTRRNLEDGASILEERRVGEGVAYVVGSLGIVPSIEPWPHLEGIQLPLATTDPWLIAAIRKRLASGFGDFFTELRPATALFAKFEGIDFEEDSAADEKLDAFFSRVQGLVNDYEGVVHQLTVGDKGSFLYAAFGAPISHEDDTQRAMAVALKLQSVARSLDYITALKIGIARGSTRTGDYGGSTRRTYGVLGDQVNLSARLMGKAEPGQILVSEPAAVEGMRSYKLEALPPIRVKGKSHPINVFRLDGEASDVQRGKDRSSYTLPLVGRKTEREQIAKIARKVIDGRGQAVSVVAAAGLGKTRLVEESIRWATEQGFRLLHGECQTFGANTQYTPWWRVWRDYFDIDGNEPTEAIVERLSERLAEVDTDLARRFPVLGPILNVSLPDNELTSSFDAKLKRASMESLLVECLRASAAKQPIMIVLEDVHAIDTDSRDLLRSIIQAIARIRVLVIIAHRPVSSESILSSDEEGLAYYRNLELGEFSEGESAELIRLKYAHLFGRERDIPRTVVERLSERTGRNPFFIDEVMNWIHHENIDIRSDDALDAVELPVSLHALVLSRMDQLDEGSRATLKVASVIGRVFRAAVIWGVYPDLGGEREILEALDKLSRSDFTELEEDGPELAYLFKHVVMHEVAYESLPKELRRRLHESIGLYIEDHFEAESSQVLDLLAFHFGRSTNTEKQRRYYLLAGDAARQAYSNKAAAAHYLAALPLLEEFDRAPVLQHLGLVLEFSGDWDGAMKHYQEALAVSERLNRRLNEANCKLHIGDILRKKGSFEESSEWLQDARKTFEQLNDEQGIGQALHTAGTLAAQTGDYDTARDLYTSSMEIRRRLGDEVKVASLLSNIGIITRFQGDYNQALLLQEESLSIRRKINDLWAIGNSLNNLGMVKRSMGNLNGARKVLEEGLEALEKVGDRAEIANTLNSLAEVALDLKDTEAGTAYLKESLRLRRELGNLRAIAFLFEAFASVAFLQNRPARCLILLGAAKDLREEIGAPLPVVDREPIDELIVKAGQVLEEGKADDYIRQGANLPLIVSLDFAGSDSDSV